MWKIHCAVITGKIFSYNCDVCCSFMWLCFGKNSTENVFSLEIFKRENYCKKFVMSFLFWEFSSSTYGFERIELQDKVHEKICWKNMKIMEDIFQKHEMFCIKIKSPSSWQCKNETGFLHAWNHWLHGNLSFQFQFWKFFSCKICENIWKNFFAIIKFSAISVVTQQRLCFHRKLSLYPLDNTLQREIHATFHPN